MFIRVENISFSYGKKEVLDDVSLSFRRGEVVSLLGPNGSGKTTLLKVLLGILKPSRGRVLFEGAPIVAIGAKRFARRVAYVPQLHHGAFSYSVLDVVLMGRCVQEIFFAVHAADNR